MNRPVWYELRAPGGRVVLRARTFTEAWERRPDADHEVVLRRARTTRVK